MHCNQEKNKVNAKWIYEAGADVNSMLSVLSML